MGTTGSKTTTCFFLLPVEHPVKSPSLPSIKEEELSFAILLSMGEMPFKTITGRVGDGAETVGLTVFIQRAWTQDVHWWFESTQWTLNTITSFTHQVSGSSDGTDMDEYKQIFKEVSFYFCYMSMLNNASCKSGTFGVE